MVTPEELGKKLKGHLETSGESGNAFAKRIGIEQASVSRLTAGKQGASFDSAMKIMAELGYTIIPPGNTAEELGEIKMRKDAQNPFGSELTVLGVYAVAGAGQAWEAEEAEPIFNIAVPRQYLRPSITPLFIRGASMEPTILDNAVVGINREQREVIQGKVYAVRLPYEGIVVKRLYLDHENARFVLKSDNKKDINEYSDIHLAFEAGDSFIYGQVAWVLQSYDR